MSSAIQSIQSQFTWSPSMGYPTATLMVKATSIDPTAIPALSASLENAVSEIATATRPRDLMGLSRVIRGAQASFTVIVAQNILATATDSAVKAEATKAIFEATYNLQELEMEYNLYGYIMNLGANYFFLVMFALILLFNVGMIWKSRYHWHNVTFVCGLILETIAFLGRVLSSTDYANMDFYLLQYTPFTIAPAFIMGGIYFLFAQNVVLYGKEYSMRKPLWYSYFFIACDVICLAVQAVGGAMASGAARNSTDPELGGWVMFAGVLAQLLAMTVFLFFWFNFFYRVFFYHSNDIDLSCKYSQRGVMNYIKLFLNLPSTREYKAAYLERYYDPKYKEVRARKLVPYFPLAISVAALVVYIRCVYRTVELKQGFSGYLITHEVYIMVLDALLIFIACFVFVPFHPVFVFGVKNVLGMAKMRGKNGADEESDEKSSHVSAMTNSSPSNLISQMQTQTFDSKTR